VHAIAATAASGDPGATALRIARRLMTDPDSRLAALASVDRAIAHSPQGTDRAALATAAQIAVAMQRWPLARAALARYIARAPEPAELKGPRWSPPKVVVAPPVERAWNPRSVAAHRALLASHRAGSPAHADAIAELMAVALSAPVDTARPALSLVLEALGALG